MIGWPSIKLWFDKNVIVSALISIPPPYPISLASNGISLFFNSKTGSK